VIAAEFGRGTGSGATFPLGRTPIRRLSVVASRRTRIVDNNRNVAAMCRPALRGAMPPHRRRDPGTRSGCRPLATIEINQVATRRLPVWSNEVEAGRPSGPHPHPSCARRGLVGQRIPSAGVDSPAMSRHDFEAARSVKRVAGGVADLASARPAAALHRLDYITRIVRFDVERGPPSTRAGAETSERREARARDTRYRPGGRSITRRPQPNRFRTWAARFSGGGQCRRGGLVLAITRFSGSGPRGARSNPAVGAEGSAFDGGDLAGQQVGDVGGWPIGDP